jgi:hypothetical protein
MFDKAKILAGLLLFLAILASPVLYNLARGSAAPPELKTGTEEKKCLEPTEYMRAGHMTLLNSWRDSVIRNEDRVYTASDGRQWDMSLTQTCLVRCHSRKTEFCDKCHNYAAVTPYCWDCHLAPEEKK